MAKKKKAKKRKIGKACALVAIIFGIAALAMMFLPAIAIKDVEDATFTGLQVAFGYSEKVPIIGEVSYFEFSIMNLLTYVLALGGVVFALFAALGSGGGLSWLIALAAFVASAVFSFMTVTFSVPNSGLEKLIGGIGSFFGKETSVKDSLTLGIGAIIGGALSAVAAISLLAKKFIK